MDRRQKKTREAIFNAFTSLLSQKDYSKITVGEIINKADVGRATFYSHFETKDYLLKEFCQELFCHIFDVENNESNHHKHIFECSSSEPAFLHLFQHLQKNDNNILTLLSSTNNTLFLNYFRENLDGLVESHMSLFENKKASDLPEDFWKNHITSTLVETIKWWINNGIKETPEAIAEYLFKVI